MAAPARRAAELPVARLDPSRVAVLLNRNARRVSDRLARKVERIVGPENLFYSRSLEEAEAFSREIVQQGFGTVVSGGGDGTLVQTVNNVRRYVDESNLWRAERFKRYGERQNLLPMPRFAFLRLGTGNGIGHVVGAGDPVHDLKRVIDYAPGRTHTISMMDTGSERCVIAGIGYDSVLLNDYNWLKQHTHNAFLKPLMHSVLGYFAALFSRTLPRIVLTDETKLQARVVNRGRGYYIDPRRGDGLVPIEPGETLFEGTAAMIGGGTMPFYGYGFRAFPFANAMPGMMHLRIYKAGPFRTLANLPAVWKGSYRHPELLLDFLVEDIGVELARPYPFQHSGDDQGMRDRLDLRVADEPLKLVDYYGPRPVT
jgi:diacylglycerol kinase family enzyme